MAGQGLGPFRIPTTPLEAPMRRPRRSLTAALVLALVTVLATAGAALAAGPAAPRVWLTTGDQAHLLLVQREARTPTLTGGQKP